MLNRFVAALCLAWLAASASASPLDSLLADALTDQSIPAIGALTIVDGKVAQVRVAGVRARDAAAPVMIEDPWNIGSNGKAMTAVVVARLVERGLLSWTTPLPELLPALATSMRPAYRKATLVELLGHRAGLPRNASLAWTEQRYGDQRPLPVQRAEYARLALSEEAVAPAPAPFAYSNSGTMIAAAICEQVTGKSFEALLQAEVYGPLGMDVRFGPTGPGQPMAHRNGKPVSGERAGNPLAYAPAGEVAMSLGSWARFAIDQLDGVRGQGKLLQAATYAFLHKEQLGWGVRTDFPRDKPQPLLMHAGSNGQWNAFIVLAPDSNSGMLVVANAGEGSNAEAAQMKILMTVLPGLLK